MNLSELIIQLEHLNDDEQAIVFRLISAVIARLKVGKAEYGDMNLQHIAEKYDLEKERSEEGLDFMIYDSMIAEIKERGIQK